MSPARLLQYFEQISEAPDAVPRLRRFILDLAVRGRLVEQDPADEPASELLQRIEIGGAQLVRGRTLRSKGSPPPITADEIPFEVPKGWELVRLGTALGLINGRAFKPGEWSDSGLPIIRIQNLNDQEAPFNYCGFSVPDKFLVKTGDFLISWSGTPGTSFGAHIWDRGPAVLNQHIFRAVLVGDAFLPKFLKLAINSRLVELIDQAHGGVGLQHVTKPKLERLPLTLPPLAEQQRIVAKVDELMALCDELEAAQAERETRRDRLVVATLHGLSNGDESVEAGTTFEDSARFYFNHLPRLTTRPEHIHQFRQTILNLAVRGKLVSQDPTNEPVGVLAERIFADQQRSGETARLRKRARSKRVERAEPLYAIPADWRWLRLGEMITFGPQNGLSPKPSNSESAPKALTLSATTSGSFRPTYYKHIDAREDECEDYWLLTGDVLFQRGNTREYVGMAAIYEGPERTFIFPDLMIRVRLSDSLSLRFVHTALISPPLRAYFSTAASGGSSSMPKISQDILLDTPIPLPPIEEQHRIVAKVDELMALCDELETRLTATTAARRQLLETMLHGALKGHS